MSFRHRLGIVITLALVLSSVRVAADPTSPCEPSHPCHLRMREDTTLIKDNGDQYRLPPGRFLDEPTFQELDDELQRLQNQETRLGAENQSLRESLDTWKPGWLTLTSAVLVGVLGGVGGYYYWTHR